MSRYVLYRSLSAEMKRRMACRKKTRRLQARGVLPRGDCEGCGDPNAENHHHWGYLRFDWYIRFCRACHRAVDPKAWSLTTRPRRPLQQAT